MVWPAVTAAVLAFLYFAVVGIHATRISKKRSAHGIMLRLQHPGDTVSVTATHIARKGGLWNPGRPPGIGNPITEPGIAIYELGADGQVHLDWHGRHGLQKFVGPPPQAHGDSSTRTMLWTMLIFGIGGISIGYLFSLVGEVGPHPDKRILITIAGFVSGLVFLATLEWIHVGRLRRIREANEQQRRRREASL